MCNTGKIDKVIRVVIGVAIIAWGFLTNNWLGVIGVVPLGTALFSFCPLYALLGVNTGCKR